MLKYLTVILLKIFDIYLRCYFASNKEIAITHLWHANDIYLRCYFASNKEIAITHLWHAIEPQTICHLIVKDKVAE